MCICAQPKSIGAAMGNFTIPYAISFVGYFSLSVATLIILSNYKGCYVRHTYKPEFLAGTASNPFFTSTQIIRHPPGVGSDDPQRAADIGAFPVIISHPYRDAAFLPVRKDDSPSLNSLFSVLPRGGIQKMLDALHSSDEEGFTVQAAHELMAKDLAALHAIMAVHSDVYNLSAASTWSRGDEVLHLLKNGMVVSPQQTMYMDTAGMMTSMLTQGMGWLEVRAKS